MTRKRAVSTHRGQFLLSITASVERSTLRISQNRQTAQGSRKKKKSQLLRGSIVTLSHLRPHFKGEAIPWRFPLFSSLRLWWPFWLRSHTSPCVFLAETSSQTTSCWTSMVSQGLLSPSLRSQCSVGYGRPMRDGGVDTRCMGRLVLFQS